MKEKSKEKNGGVEEESWGNSEEFTISRYSSSVVPKLVCPKPLITMLATPSTSRVKCLKKLNLEIEFSTKN